MRCRSSSLVFSLTIVVAGLADVAYAQCAAAIEALETADRQERLAQYNVENREQALTRQPFLVRIGKVVYTGSERSETSGTNPILASLRDAEKQGKAKCEAGGDDMYRGAAVSKIRYYNPTVPKAMNPMTLWISKSSGLPVYHEVPGLGTGGYAWIYGAAVKEPRSK